MDQVEITSVKLIRTTGGVGPLTVAGRTFEVRGANSMGTIFYVPVELSRQALEDKKLALIVARGYEHSVPRGGSPQPSLEPTAQEAESVRDKPQGRRGKGRKGRRGSLNRGDEAPLEPHPGT